MPLNRDFERPSLRETYDAMRVVGPAGFDDAELEDYADLGSPRLDSYDVIQQGMVAMDEQNGEVIAQEPDSHQLARALREAEYEPEDAVIFDASVHSIAVPEVGE